MPTTSIENGATDLRKEGCDPSVSSCFSAGVAPRMCDVDRLRRPPAAGCCPRCGRQHREAARALPRRSAAAASTEECGAPSPGACCLRPIALSGRCHAEGVRDQPVIMSAQRRPDSGRGRARCGSASPAEARPTGPGPASRPPPSVRHGTRRPRLGPGAAVGPGGPRGLSLAVASCHSSSTCELAFSCRSIALVLLSSYMLAYPNPRTR